MGPPCLVSLVLLQLLALARCHSPSHSAHDLSDLQAKWGTDWSFSGVSTFAHLPHVRCLTQPDDAFDVGIIGAPFDTAVSYRPGARFGPRAIRAASARQMPMRAYNHRARFNPYAAGWRIVDCGDVPVTPFDNGLALRQLTQAYAELSARPAAAASLARPRFLTLGGDHSVGLAELRALRAAWGQPVTVLHFDAHLDTWHPAAYPSYWLDDDKPIEEQQSAFTHGTMYWLAWQEGLVANGSVHAGLRTRLTDAGDEANDDAQGWTRIDSDEISPHRLGPDGVARRIMSAIGSERPVYLSVDIDVIDPGLAPGTGTPEPGGWLTRELVQVLRGVSGLNVVGADVVEVSPSYDGAGEQTALAAAQVAYELLTSMVQRGVEGADAGGTAATGQAEHGEL